MKKTIINAYGILIGDKNKEIKTKPSSV